MLMNAHALAHPLTRVASGATGVVASGVSAAEVTNVVGGIVIALVSLVGLLIGISRNNKRNRELAKDQKVKAYRRGYRRARRELAQIVSDASYWRTYALENRRVNAPAANPPIVVPSSVPDEDDTEDSDGDEDDL